MSSRAVPFFSVFLLICFRSSESVQQCLLPLNIATVNDYLRIVFSLGPLQPSLSPRSGRDHRSDHREGDEDDRLSSRCGHRGEQLRGHSPGHEHDLKHGNRTDVPGCKRRDSFR